MSTNISVERICLHCGNQFTAKTTVTKYCSHTCNSRAYKAKSRDSKIKNSQSESAYRQIELNKSKLDKDVLKVKDIAEVLNISVDAVYDLINNGKIRASNLSKRMTRVLKSDLYEYLDSTRIVGNIRTRTVQEENVINQTVENDANIALEKCYSIPQICNMFGMERSSLYTTLQRAGIKKMKVKKEIFYLKSEVDKFYKERQGPKLLGLQKLRNSNLKSKGPLKIEDCYSIEELEGMFNMKRSNLYSFFKRRAIPTIKVGTRVFLSKKSIDKLPPLLK